MADTKTTGNTLVTDIRNISPANWQEAADMGNREEEEGEVAEARVEVARAVVTGVGSQLLETRDANPVGAGGAVAVMVATAAAATAMAAVVRWCN